MPSAPAGETGALSVRNRVRESKRIIPGRNGVSEKGCHTSPFQVGVSDLIPERLTRGGKSGEVTLIKAAINPGAPADHHPR